MASEADVSDNIPHSGSAEDQPRRAVGGTCQEFAVDVKAYILDVPAVWSLLPWHPAAAINRRDERDGAGPAQ